MKRYAAVFFLIGVTLLIMHLLGKDPQWLGVLEGRWDSKVCKDFGLYVRGGIAAVGVMLWMSAKTSQ